MEISSATNVSDVERNVNVAIITLHAEPGAGQTGTYTAQGNKQTGMVGMQYPFIAESV